MSFGDRVIRMAESIVRSRGQQFIRYPAETVQAMAGDRISIGGDRRSGVSTLLLAYALTAFTGTPRTDVLLVSPRRRLFGEFVYIAKEMNRDGVISLDTTMIGSSTVGIKDQPGIVRGISPVTNVYGCVWNMILVDDFDETRSVWLRDLENRLKPRGRMIVRGGRDS